MNVGNLFNKDVVTVPPGATLSLVARLMAENNVGAVVVAENEHPLGIITDRDLALALGAQELSLKVPVEEVMSSPVLTINQHDGIFKATQMILESATRRLPVVDGDGTLVGIVSADDLLIFLTRELHNIVRGIAKEVTAVS